MPIKVIELPRRQTKREVVIEESELDMLLRWRSAVQIMLDEGRELIASGNLAVGGRMLKAASLLLEESTVRAKKLHDRIKRGDRIQLSA